MSSIEADELAGPGAVLTGRGLTKSFGHIRALEDVDVSVGSGEVLALVGDNGAGKSTLMKVVAGVFPPDAGELSLHGVPVGFRSPLDARRQGIAAVFQDLAVVECLDIATNLFLGELPRRRMFVDRRHMDEEAVEVLRRMNVGARSPRTPLGLLPAGHRQIIAIARALRLDAPVVVMDEPTAALGVRETAQVGAVIEDLKARHKAVIIISHDLEFVFQHADRIQVMRLGRTAAIRARRDTDRDEIVGLITGSLSHVHG